MTGCDYDHLLYVADWFPIILQMASGNTLRNGDIHSKLDLDGLGLWSNVLYECGHEDRGNEDNELVRDEIVSARLCDDDYFYSSSIQKVVGNAVT